MGDQFLGTVKKSFPDLKNIFEVGAHRGYDIKELLDDWPESNIYAFEADPFNYKICKEKFQHDERVHIYHLAVTDVTEKVVFNRFHDVESIPDSETLIGKNMQHTGIGSILKLGKGMKEIYKVTETTEEIEVQGTSLNDFCSTHNIESIDAIFMDVQGAEFKVLKGCGDLVNTLKALVFEWSTNYVLYEDETDFNLIKPYLENTVKMKEVLRQDQLPGINGDSLFLKQ